MTLSADGLLYGLISQGGAYGNGVIFSYNPDSENPYVDLYDFDGTNGRMPSGGLTLGNDGKYYGLTNVGGANDQGVIFSFEPNAEIPYNKLYDFENSTGKFPSGSLVQGDDGVFYGLTTWGGNNNQGVIFSFEPNAEIPYNKLYDFENSTGRFPYGSLVQGDDGVFYGLTSYGGAHDNGVIFSFDPEQETPFNVVYNFDGEHGGHPRGSLVSGDDGIFYGLARGDEDTLDGFIFSFDPSAEVPFSDLYNFNGIEGSDPFSSLVKGSNGVLYGLTQAGGLNNMGVIFSFDPSSEDQFKKLFDFDNSNGRNPFGSLVEDDNNFLYGFTQSGGANNMGIVFQFDPTPQPPKVLNLYITGVRLVGSILTGHYTYFDSENDSEGTSIYQWYRDDIAIDGADSTTYTLTPEDMGKLIEFEVTPISQIVPTTGEAVRTSIGTSIIVNSSLDDGDGTCTEEKCTLRDAISNSSEGSTVEFGEELNSPIVLTQGYIEINHDLNIEGPGSSVLSIDGNNNDMVFYIIQGMVTISGLTFTNGLASDYGGVIENDGNSPLFIDNCVFIDNDSNDQYGGAIYDNSFTTLTITNSTFTANNSYDGGAIFIEGGDLIIRNSTFNENVASNYGGAIYHYGYGDLIITNSTFVNNTDSGDGSIESYANLTEITNSTFYNDDKLNYNGLYLDNNTLITNSIFYSVNNYNCYDGSYTSGGHNIDSGSSCGFSGEGDINFISGYTNLYNFGQNDGIYPIGSLIEGSNGVFYGLTSNGGAESKVGTIFTYEPNSETPFNKLYDFDQEEGGFAPNGNLVKGSNGIFYGLTSSGGLTGSGTIFSYDPSLETPFTKLHDFDNLSIPKGSLIEGENGILYGLSYGGGDYSSGYIFSYNPNSETPYVKLYDLSAVDTGSYPNGSLLFAGDGIFYGMTQFGGSFDKGAIFSFDPSAEIPLIKLHDFDGTTGSYPHGSLIEGSDGLLYGMTQSGGENDAGVIFAYDQSAENPYSVLHDFDSLSGNYPYGSLIEGSDGIFYGLTSGGGGLSDSGVIFSYDLNAEVPYVDLYDFNVTSGGYPSGSLIKGSDGLLYGMTQSGGENDAGVIFSYEINSLQTFDFDGLKNNGGPVETVALGENSPAINAGDDAKAPETDARGYRRLSISDIGAYEYGGIPPAEPEEQDETCSDGIQNQNETGIDSGGVCQSTSVNRHHSSGSLIKQPLLVIINTIDDRGCLLGYLFSVQTGKPCPVEKFSTINKNQQLLSRTLKLGMQGNDVRELQVYLNSHGYILSSNGAGSPGKETIKFGPLTKKAVIKFQLANGLVGDGIVGILTQAKLQ